MATGWQDDWLKTLKCVWFNIFMTCRLSFAVVYALITNLAHRGARPQKNALPMAVVFRPTTANLLLHFLAVYLSFIPLVPRWLMQDVVHGRGDQYAVDPAVGEHVTPRHVASPHFGATAVLDVYKSRDNVTNFISFIHLCW